MRTMTPTTTSKLWFISILVHRNELSRAWNCWTIFKITATHTSDDCHDSAAREVVSANIRYLLSRWNAINCHLFPDQQSLDTFTTHSMRRHLNDGNGDDNDGSHHSLISCYFTFGRPWTQDHSDKRIYSGNEIHASEGHVFKYFYRPLNSILDVVFVFEIIKLTNITSAEGSSFKVYIT